jgi:hypothetical protein
MYMHLVHNQAQMLIQVLRPIQDQTITGLAPKQNPAQTATDLVLKSRLVQTLTGLDLK